MIRVIAARGANTKQCCLAKDEAEAREARASAAAAAPAGESEAAAEPGRPAARPPRPSTQQPWKKAALQAGFHQKVRTPRKVGGS